MALNVYSLTVRHPTTFPRPKVVGSVDQAVFDHLSRYFSSTGLNALTLKAIYNEQGLRLDSYDDLEVNHGGKTLRELVVPFLGPVATHQRTLDTQNPVINCTIWRADVPPGASQLGTYVEAWHTDSRTYNCASQLPTEFAEGETPYDTDNPNPFIGQRTDELPEGLRIYRPSPGDIVTFDHRNPHRSPLNTSSEAIERILAVMAPGELT